MSIETLNKKITEQLCLEYQSVWLINVADLHMTIFAANEAVSIPNSIDIVKQFDDYELANSWYIEHCVFENDKERVKKQTEMPHIIEKIKELGSYFVEYSRVSAGFINYNQLCYFGINDDDGELEYVLLGFRNIDVRKNAEIDDLTGLYTRQVFFQKAEKLLKDNPDKSYDIILSDIVDFKVINETYGAYMGDEILRWIGSELAPGIREDVIIGRYGGDQIATIAEHSYVKAITDEGFSKEFLDAEATNGLPHVTVKFGIYEGVKRNKSIISTCDKAHMALNSIKHRYGKTIAVYSEELKNELETNRKIENSMHIALNEGQFKVYYQPKHDAKTGKLVGAEALIRWIHPEFGFMSPGEFIPLFEKNGFITEIDDFVWGRTCENIRRWQDAGLKTVPISVNASKLTIELPNLIQRMQGHVEKNGLSPDDLHVEITETLMADDVELLVKKLILMRSIGYKIELDDFGAGYSSINILSTIPLDVVKLDMSFMKQFGDEKRSKVLVACIKLAKELGYKTVSEGVELKEQRDMLDILGVDIIQGYYYSKPLPETEFEEYMKKYV